MSTFMARDVISKSVSTDNFFKIGNEADFDTQSFADRDNPLGGTISGTKDMGNVIANLYGLAHLLGTPNSRRGAKPIWDTVALSGTWSSSTLNNQLVGSSGSALSEINPNEFIVINNKIKQVISVSNDDLINIVGEGHETLSGQTIYRLIPLADRVTDIYDLLGVNIGQPIPIIGASAPDQTRYIKLSKDLTGSGLYNENKLTGQLTSVTGEQTFYTAVISDTDSPLFGQTIPLINSTIDNNSGLIAPTVISASETSGLIRHNRFQGHYYRHGTNDTTYALGWDGTGGSNYTQDQTGGSSGFITSLPQALQSDGIHGTPRNDYTTEQNNVTATFYMRIK